MYVLKNTCTGILIPDKLVLAYITSYNSTAAICFHQHSMYVCSLSTSTGLFPLINTTYMSAH